VAAGNHAMHAIGLNGCCSGGASHGVRGNRTAISWKRMLNRKFADFRHAPALDPRILSHDPDRLPQTWARVGPDAATKVKGGLVLAEPGWLWAAFFFPDRWYSVMRIFDAARHHVADHIDIARPAEPVDNMPSFLDLKLDLVLGADGKGR